MNSIALLAVQAVGVKFVAYMDNCPVPVIPVVANPVQSLWYNQSKASFCAR